MNWRWWLLLSLVAVGCTCGAPDGGVRDARPDARDGGFDAGDAGDAGGAGDDAGTDVPAPVDAGDDAEGDGATCGDGGRCAAGDLCVGGACAPDRGPCGPGDVCGNDSMCAPGTNRCAGFTPGRTDPACTREVRAGVFAPQVQCAFAAAPAGDAFPQHLHVLSTPMVADLRVYRDPGAPTRPSIIAVFDDGVDGASENPTGLIRILDGRTCALQDNLSEQMVSHSSPPAIADLDGDGTPEIVAFKAEGGLVAFRYVRAASGGDAGADADAESDGGADGAGAPRGAWRVMWRSTDAAGAPFNPTGGGWAGPSVYDLDDDGRPEVFRHGQVFDGQTGRLIGGGAVLASLRGYSQGAFTVVQDVDEDGAPELVTGAGVFRWNAMARDWALEGYYMRSGCPAAGCGEGHVAVGDLGDYSSARVPEAGLPEIAVVSAGHLRVDAIDGRTVFGPIALPGGGTGGPPTIADFDGDGLREIAAAGARAYSVFDPDCAPSVPLARRGGRCMTGATNGVLWSRPAQDVSSNVTGSTSFDFEGDGRVEAVYADECFARVYDGATGEVLFSQHHSSCTWYENPVVADVDGDFRAEIVVGSNFNCGSATTGIACPDVGPRSIDVQFAGIRCATNADCPSGTCASGFCRCTMDAQCCPAMSGECTYVCTAPPAGTPGTGNTCRASRPVGVRGLRVYSDVADRWVRSRMIWNQHVYNVTNVGDDGRIPRAGAVARNWRDRSLNNFRTNVQGVAEVGASPDATAFGVRVDCLEAGARITARVCDRGTAPLPDGVSVGVYDGDPDAGGTLVCRVLTPRALNPGECVDVSCAWPAPPTRMPTTLYIRADDARATMECHEDNNLATIRDVVCRPPG